MPDTVKHNIFAATEWSPPDIKSIELALQGGQTFSWAGKNYTIQRLSDNTLQVAAEGATPIVAERKPTDGKMFYDKGSLKLKEVTRGKWITFRTTEEKLVTVAKTREIVSMVYDPVSKGTRESVTTETYYEPEMQSVPKVETIWQPFTDYVLDIPVYDSYTFSVTSDAKIIVYEVRQGTGVRYYLQNPSFHSAVDQDGVNHLLIDANSNGYYYDAVDKMMFNSWDPYSKASSYKKVKSFKENSWYDLQYLRDEKFLSVNTDSGYMHLIYENARFTDDKAKGKVTFTGVPDNCELFVNGNKYNIKAGDKTYKSEFGKFKARISRVGYVDYEVVYTLDDKLPEIQLAYKETARAGECEISNISSSEFIASVTGANGYTHVFYNQKKMNLPEGDGHIQIFADGTTFNKDISLKYGERVIIDFEKEAATVKR